VISPESRRSNAHATNVTAFGGGQAAEVDLVVVAQEGGPLGLARQPRRVPQPLPDRLGVAAGQPEHQGLVEPEVEEHRRAAGLVVRGAEVLEQLVLGHVRLGEQHGVPALPGSGFPQPPEEAEVPSPA
jgi:hypothetical protein